MQQFSFIFVESKQRKSCVNPRAMNYNFGRNHLGNSKNENEMQAPSVSDTSAIRRIETFYDIREVLGDGTQGQVRRAIHRQSGEERAVKIISLRRHVDASILEREVNLVCRVLHDVYQSQRTEHMPCLPDNILNVVFIREINFIPRLNFQHLNNLCWELLLKPPFFKPVVLDAPKVKFFSEKPLLV